MINPEETARELKRLRQIRGKINRALKDAPEGSVYFVLSGKSREAKPYLNRRVDGKRCRKRLKNVDSIYLNALKFKTYADHIRPRVDRNITALTYALKYVPFDDAFLSFGGEPFAECRKHFFGEVPYNPEFEALQERQNPSHPEQLNIVTELGVFRSREEYMVARALTILGLRFKYETILSTPYRDHYPDFAVLHPVTGKIIYIEYCGKMHQQGYRRSFLNRLPDYGDASVYLGINLFVIAFAAGSGFDMAAAVNRLKGIFEL